MKQSVGAVIVAFAPEPERFARVLAAAAAQADCVVVVDNAEGAGLDAVAWSPRLERIDMGGNAGVAAAQNAGLRRAFERGATHAVLLDHDSVAGPGMVGVLLSAWQRLSESGHKVATIGANYVDPRRPNASPFISIRGWRLRRIRCSADTPIVEVSYVISSGCVLSRESFAEIGAMNESLFIDYIDIEWGLRAGAKGWRCFGACQAHLEHALGDAPLTLFGNSYPLRSPLRHYFMVRNASYLILRTSLPPQWKFVESWRLVRRAMAYALFAPGRARHTAAMMRGLCDGVRGRMGALRLAERSPS